MNSSSFDSLKKLFDLKETSQKLNVPVEVLIKWNEINILKPTITLEGTIVYTEDQINQFITIKQLVNQDKILPEKTGNQEQANSSNLSNKTDSHKPQYSQTSENENINNSANKILNPNPGEFGFSKAGVLSSKPHGVSRSVVGSALAIIVLALIFGVFAQIKDQKPTGEIALHSSEKNLSVQTSKLKSSGVGYVATPVKFKKDSKSGDVLKYDGENMLNEKFNLLNILFSRSQDNVVKKTQTLAKVSQSSDEKFGKELGNEGNIKNGLSDDSDEPTYSSMTTRSETENNLIFDNNGKIKGETTNSISTILGGMGSFANTPSLKQISSGPINIVFFLVVGILLYFYIFSKNPLFSSNSFNTNQITQSSLPQVLPEKIIEVDQKTDGTIVFYLKGIEYKISKPELYSESDQFIERLMELVRPGIKEIEYVVTDDQKIETKTPLSRLVTRLGFVGIKRDLFFPRTSKDRVLFRRYLTTHDLRNMNLTTDQISTDLTTIS